MSAPAKSSPKPTAPQLPAVAVDDERMIDRGPSPNGIVSVGGRLMAARSAKEGREIITRSGRLHEMWEPHTLTSETGQIYSADKGKTWNIAASGYDALNATMGMHVELPPFVSVDNVSAPNPHLQRDAKGRIQTVLICLAVAGRDGNGNVCVYRETLAVQPDMWFLLALVKAVKSNEKGGGVSDVGEIIATRAIPKDLPGCMAVYELDDVSSVIVNLQAEKIREIFENRENARRDAMKRAATVARRRVFSAHPGAPISKLHPSSVKVTWKKETWSNGTVVDVVDKAVATIMVRGWVERDGESGVVRKAAESIKKGGPIDADFKVQDLGNADERDIDREESAPHPMEEAAPETTPQGDAPASAQAPAAEPKEESEAIGIARASLQALWKMPGGKDAGKAICAKHLTGGRKVHDLTDEEASRLTAEVDDVIERLSVQGGES